MFDKVIEINGFSVHARYTQATVETCSGRYAQD